MEDELGVLLLERGCRGVSLTAEGAYFLRKAEEILSLAERAKDELRRGKEDIGGEVSIACGESPAMTHMAMSIAKMRREFPGIVCNLLSGNAESARRWLEDGLASFGLFVMPANMNGLEFIRLPYADEWGVLMRKDDPLVEFKGITAAMLEGKNIICSAQGLVDNEFAGWFGNSLGKVNIVAKYSLLFNASMLVGAGVGVAFALKGIINTGAESPFAFRELVPPMKADLVFAWKINSVFSKAARVFKNFFEQDLIGFRC